MAGSCELEEREVEGERCGLYWVGGGGGGAAGECVYGVDLDGEEFQWGDCGVAYGVCVYGVFLGGGGVCLGE